jgi:hypothetical protein
MTQPQPTEEVWVFGGTRCSTQGKRVHAWLPAGQTRELWFKAGGSHAIGARYTVRVVRSEDGGVTLYGTPAYQGRDGDDAEQARELESLHRAAETRLRLLALERNTKRHSTLDAAVQPLCDLVAKAPSADRDALIAYVLRRLSRAW